MRRAFRIVLIATGIAVGCALLVLGTDP